MSRTADRYTDGSYLASNPDWHAERSAWKADHVIRAVDRENVTFSTVCDIGCGVGRVLSSLVERRPATTLAVGFEPSTEVPLDAASLHPLVRVENRSPAPEDGSFDLALMMDVFEHVEDPLGFLRECRPLAPVFVFHVPLDANCASILKSGFMNARAKLGHLHYFTRETALATLSDAGFEPVGWHFTHAAWTGPGRRRHSPGSLLRRSLAALSEDFASKTTGGLSLMVVARSASNGEAALPVGRARTE